MSTLHTKKMGLYIICVTIITTLAGGCYYALYNDWIVITIPQKTVLAQEQNKIKKQKVRLFMWSHNSYKQETQELLWPIDTEKQLDQLIRNWLSFVQEIISSSENNSSENTESKKQHSSQKIKTIKLESVAISQTGQLFLSLNTSPFSPEDSVQKKLMFIESLLKTVRENNKILTQEITSIYFFVHQKTLSDYHLDFSHEWPISGFCSEFS